MKIEKFRDLFSELSNSDKIRIFNEYAMDYACDDQLYVFDEDFFNTCYENNPMEAVRASFFGNIKNWGDEYLRFNGYGNIVSMSTWEAAEWAKDYVDEIFEHEESGRSILTMKKKKMKNNVHKTLGVAICFGRWYICPPTENKAFNKHFSNI